MRGIAILFRIGLLAAGVLGMTSIAWGCDERPTASGSTCSASKVAATAPATPAPTVPQAATSTSTTTTGAAPAAAGMRAYIDPETGVLGGPGALPPLTEEEMKLLEPEVQEEPVETVLPDGSVILDLKGHGQEYFILQLDANAQRVVRCVEDPKTALQSVPKTQPEDR